MTRRMKQGAHFHHHLLWPERTIGFDAEIVFIGFGIVIEWLVVTRCLLLLSVMRERPLFLDIVLEPIRGVAQTIVRVVLERDS